MLWEQHDARAPIDGLRIGVLLGGRSSERDVSLKSGQRVAEALRLSNHRVSTIDPLDTDIFDIDWTELDVCFIALHGGAGEDGRIQAKLDEIDIPYTGSCPIASRLAMSKSASKGRFLERGVPTAPGVSFHARTPSDEIVARLSRLGFPLVIKPDGQGCSLGVSVAHSAVEIARCVEQASQFESLLLAETLLIGSEFTVAVIDRQPLPVVEILHRKTLFDFDEKFGEAPLELGFPDADTEPLKLLAVHAADAIGTRGLARIDIVQDFAGQPWVLEVNTIPGLTERSLAPLAAERAGMDLSQLCDRLVRSCIAQEVAA